MICSSCSAAFPLRPRIVQRHSLTPGYAVTDYAGQAQEVVHAYKQVGSVAIARFMASCISRGLRHEISDLQRRGGGRLLLVPAPSRPSSIRLRGYQPAELVAKELARLLRATGNDAVVDSCLKVDTAVQDQSLLNASQREANLMGHVSVSAGAAVRLREGRVVLVDDIVTTGSTLRAMQVALADVDVFPEFFLSFSETL